MKRTPPRLPVLLLSLFCGSAGAEDQAFHARARVLQAEPVVETVAVPLETERCTYSERAGRADRAMGGDVRSMSPGLSISAAVAEEIRHREKSNRQYRCRIETQWEHREEVVAYRVRYEFDGETFVGLLHEHPGDWIQVKVRLSTR